jgi:hypothetical protein
MALEKDFEVEGLPEFRINGSFSEPVERPN